MNVLIMMDSFKGSISSYTAGCTVKEAIKKINPADEITVLPVADGGEGTVFAFQSFPNHQSVQVTVNNPLFEKTQATYVIAPDGKSAIMEMSQAAGITLIQNRLAPLKASTYGVGEMIIDALNKGIRHFIIGIGGSATNDGGVGMLQALGYRFLNYQQKEIPAGNSGLSQLVSIDISKADERLAQCTFDIACDVDNPLNGERGSARVFAPQKGASAEEVEIIERNLLHYHQVTQTVIPSADNIYPGVGAAGGLGYAFKNYLHGNLQSGIELILQLIQAKNYIEQADLVITGEGKMDFQTAMGKTPVGVAKFAKKYGKKVIAFAGVVDNDAVSVNQAGIDAFFPILDQLTTLEEALSEEKAKANLSRAVSQVINLINLWR